MATPDTFNPASAKELLEALEDDAGEALTGYWNIVKVRISDNLKVLSETTIRTAEARLKGEITDADVDSILISQEHLINSLLITTNAIPYIAAQKALNAIFRVIGIVVSNRTGGLINPFP